MHTLEKFLAGSALRMRCQQVAPNADDGLLADVGDHYYRCELYRTGAAHPVRTVVATDNGPPEVGDAVDAVAAEAAVIEEAGSYEAWALQMGFDPDSRRGERIYRRERRQASHLRALLGEAGYRDLLWETERL
ncbi:MAG TPA: hypothetical protein VG294_19960 [Solirubrobacteraceae bacterium]|jgi:hypothetical protein|nr:hypothetical protein [Solirubrobacteraceae bacterium]